MRRAAWLAVAAETGGMIVSIPPLKTCRGRTEGGRRRARRYRTTYTDAKAEAKTEAACAQPRARVRRCFRGIAARQFTADARGLVGDEQRVWMGLVRSLCCEEPGPKAEGRRELRAPSRIFFWLSGKLVICFGLCVLSEKRRSVLRRRAWEYVGRGLGARRGSSFRRGISCPWCLCLYCTILLGDFDASPQGLKDGSGPADIVY